MASKTKYDPEKYYDVLINTVVMNGKVKLLPRDRHMVRGDVLNDKSVFPDSVVDEAIEALPRVPTTEA